LKKIFNVLIFVLILALSYQLYSCNLKLNVATNNIVTTSSPKIIYKDKIIKDYKITCYGPTGDTFEISKKDYDLMTTKNNNNIILEVKKIVDHNSNNELKSTGGDNELLLSELKDWEMKNKK
jgi:hypothetical protein